MSITKRLVAALVLSFSFANSATLAQDAADSADAAGGVDAADSADAIAQPSPEAVAVKQDYDAAYGQWVELVDQIRQAQTERDAAADGPERERLDATVLELRRQADELVEKLFRAGLDVYRVDPDAYPNINRIMLSVAQFYLTGNAEGDGGDQYEKALPLVTDWLEAGAGENWPDLWLWGAVAVYCTNEFDLAEQYFAKAREAGVFGVNPPTRNPADPRLRIWELATNFDSRLPAVKRLWEREQQIRAAEAEADDLPRVRLKTTKGDIVIELFENEAPESVANMITLVKQGYYDGVVFHRVLPGFMAQGGDPAGTGAGGPGYAIRDEHTKPNYRHHFRGSVSMAKAEAPNTGGSQFFLTFVPTTYLDGRHTVFGRIIEGMDVAAALKRRNPQSPPPHPEPDRIVEAEVIRDRGHAYEFEKLPEQ